MATTNTMRMPESCFVRRHRRRQRAKVAALATSTSLLVTSLSLIHIHHPTPTSITSPSSSFFFTSAQTWEESNDPDHLCTSGSTKVSGYKATLDCRGYVYCSDGYLMGGVIPCWPNQLFSEALSTCTKWQDVDLNDCPGNDGSMMMPELTDGNANPERFFCGYSSSNAKSVCEACPGGSRLECSNPSHNCYAGITGCPDTPPSPPSPPSPPTPPSPPPPPTPPSSPTPPTPPPPPPPTSDAVSAPAPNPDHSMTDEHANPERFFCGASSSNAKRVCEPCPSGSSEDCSDPGHYCFAGVTGCPSSPGSPSQPFSPTSPSPPTPPAPPTSVDVPVSVPEPTPVVVLPVPVSTPDPTPEPTPNPTPFPTEPPTNPPTNSPTSPPVTIELVNPNPSATNAQEAPPPDLPDINDLTLHGFPRSTYYCGYSWELTLKDCKAAHPCPSGLNTQCPSGQFCYPDTPCGIENNSPPPPTRNPTPQPISKEQEQYYCGYDWDWVIENCATAQPCPHADTTDGANTCPQGMKCIAGTPCNMYGLPTQTPTPLPTKRPIVSYPPVQLDDEEKRFCGYDWTDVTENCLTAIPCPGGDAVGVCPDNMNCIAETPCKDEEYLDWLRGKQSDYGSEGGLGETTVDVESANDAEAQNAEKSVCATNSDCQSGMFCNYGFCGQCSILDSTKDVGCATEEVCRTGQCQTVQSWGVTKCYLVEDLHDECRRISRQESAICDVESMKCEVTFPKVTVDSSGGADGSSSGSDADSGSSGSSGSVPAEETTNSNSGSGAAMYENPDGNEFFCGTTYFTIMEICLESKPCPGGFGTGICETDQGCFAVPPCTEVYLNPPPPPPPTSLPTITPTPLPTNEPTTLPTNEPTPLPTPLPSSVPTGKPTFASFSSPTQSPASNTVAATEKETTTITTTSTADATTTTTTATTTTTTTTTTATTTSSSVLLNSNPDSSPEASATTIASATSTTKSSSIQTSPTTTTAPISQVDILASNTNFCGVDWMSHGQDCENSIPCPMGDECPSGQTCFNDSPCSPNYGAAAVDAADGAEGGGASNVGNFCGKEWNTLLVECKQATPCPRGDECPEGEFCYRDFVCDPPPTTSSTAATSAAAGVAEATIGAVTTTTTAAGAITAGETAAVGGEVAKETETSTQSGGQTTGQTVGQTSDQTGQTTGSTSGQTAGQTADGTNGQASGQTADSTNGQATGQTGQTAQTGQSSDNTASTSKGPQNGSAESASTNNGATGGSTVDIGGNTSSQTDQSTEDVGTGGGGSTTKDKGFEQTTVAEGATASESSSSSGSNNGQTASQTIGQTAAGQTSGESTGQTTVESTGQTSGQTFDQNTDQFGDQPSGQSGAQTSTQTASQGQSGSSPNPTLTNPTNSFCGTSLANLVSTKCANAMPCYHKMACPTGEACFDNVDACVDDGKRGVPDTGGTANTVNTANTPNTPDEANTPNDNEVFEPCNLCGTGSQLDWSQTVNFNGTDLSCGEFGWIFSSENIREGSDPCLTMRSAYFGSCCFTPPENGCRLCDTGTDGPWYDVRLDVNVEYEGQSMPCAELSNKVSTKFETSSQMCTDAQTNHFQQCCFDKCNVCEDAQLDWDATVFFSGQEVACHQFDVVFQKEGVSSDSSRCSMSRDLYFDTCCIVPPEEPCNLCRSGTTYYNMNSDVIVTYNGTSETCLQVYSSLFERREQSSDHCANAQVELFNQCCDSSSGLTIDEESDGQMTMNNAGSEGVAPAPSPLVEGGSTAPTTRFNTWYAGGISPASTRVISFGTAVLSSLLVVIIASTI